MLLVKPALLLVLESLFAEQLALQSIFGDSTSTVHCTLHKYERIIKVLTPLIGSVRAREIGRIFFWIVYCPLTPYGVLRIIQYTVAILAKLSAPSELVENVCREVYGTTSSKARCRFCLYVFTGTSGSSLGKLRVPVDVQQFYQRKCTSSVIMSGVNTVVCLQ